MKKINKRTRSGLTIFARAVLYLVALTALSVCFILFPELAREEIAGKPHPEIVYTFLACAYILAVPFFIALYETNRLLGYVDKNKAFSVESIKTLSKIKICALVFTILFFTFASTGIGLIKIMTPDEDMAGFGPITFAFTLVSTIVTVFLALLQRILTDATQMQTENDLTV